MRRPSLRERRAGRPGLAQALLERLGYDEADDAFAADSPLLWASNAEIAAAWAAMPELAGRVDTRGGGSPPLLPIRTATRCSPWATFRL